MTKAKYKVYDIEPVFKSEQRIKEHYCFGAAIEDFRTRILAQNESTIKEITDMIENYAVEHYPVDTPRAFKLLADIIFNLLTDPTYPQNPDDIEFENFEDDTIKFYMDAQRKTIYCDVFKEEDDGIFPLAEINVIKMDDENKEYCFFLTHQMDCLCISWHSYLTPVD